MLCCHLRVSLCTVQRQTLRQWCVVIYVCCCARYRGRHQDNAVLSSTCVVVHGIEVDTRTMLCCPIRVLLCTVQRQTLGQCCVVLYVYCCARYRGRHQDNVVLSYTCIVVHGIEVDTRTMLCCHLRVSLCTVQRQTLGQCCVVIYVCRCAWYRGRHQDNVVLSYTCIVVHGIEVDTRTMLCCHLRVSLCTVQRQTLGQCCVVIYVCRCARYRGRHQDNAVLSSTCVVVHGIEVDTRTMLCCPIRVLLCTVQRQTLGQCCVVIYVYCCARYRGRHQDNVVLSYTCIVVHGIEVDTRTMLCCPIRVLLCTVQRQTLGQCCVVIYVCRCARYRGRHQDNAVLSSTCVVVHGIEVDTRTMLCCPIRVLLCTVQRQTLGQCCVVIYVCRCARYRGRHQDHVVLSSTCVVVHGIEVDTRTMLCCHLRVSLCTVQRQTLGQCCVVLYVYCCARYRGRHQDNAVLSSTCVVVHGIEVDTRTMLCCHLRVSLCTVQRQTLGQCCVVIYVCRCARYRGRHQDNVVLSYTCIVVHGIEVDTRTMLCCHLRVLLCTAQRQTLGQCCVVLYVYCCARYRGRHQDNAVLSSTCVVVHGIEVDTRTMLCCPIRVLLCTVQRQTLGQCCVVLQVYCCARYRGRHQDNVVLSSTCVVVHGIEVDTRTMLCCHLRVSLCTVQRQTLGQCCVVLYVYCCARYRGRHQDNAVLSYTCVVVHGIEVDTRTMLCCPIRVLLCTVQRQTLGQCCVVLYVCCCARYRGRHQDNAVLSYTCVVVHGIEVDTRTMLCCPIRVLLCTVQRQTLGQCCVVLYVCCCARYRGRHQDNAVLSYTCVVVHGIEVDTRTMLCCPIRVLLCTVQRQTLGQCCVVLYVCCCARYRGRHQDNAVLSYTCVVVHGIEVDTRTMLCCPIRVLLCTVQRQTLRQCCVVLYVCCCARYRGRHQDNAVLSYTCVVVHGIEVDTRTMLCCPIRVLLCTVQRQTLGQCCVVLYVCCCARYRGRHQDNVVLSYTCVVVHGIEVDTRTMLCCPIRVLLCTVQRQTLGQCCVVLYVCCCARYRGRHQDNAVLSYTCVVVHGIEVDTRTMLCCPIRVLLCTVQRQTLGQCCVVLYVCCCARYRGRHQDNAVLSYTCVVVHGIEVDTRTMLCCPIRVSLCTVQRQTLGQCCVVLYVCCCARYRGRHQDNAVLSYTCVVVHGIEVDTRTMLCCPIRVLLCTVQRQTLGHCWLPRDQLEATINLVRSFSRLKKVTLRELPSFIGTLNFACKVTVPGRSFLRCLSDLTIGIVKPNFHKRW